MNGGRHDNMIDGSTHAALRDDVARAVDFRGDVTLTTTEGSTIEGYVFDASLETLDAACIRILPCDGSPRRSIALREIARIDFTGKDAASGKSWENWLRRYAERKLAGQDASIESEPLG
jgi:hypothetical protein